jgi:hypothetical protein
MDGEYGGNSFFIGRFALDHQVDQVEGGGTGWHTLGFD